MIVASGLFWGCSLQPHQTTLRLRFGGPSYPSEFQCLGVMVTGEGISSQDPLNQTADWKKIYDGGLCPYPGISTKVSAIPSARYVDFSLTLPTGNKRTVQVMGIVTTGGCPTETVSELLIANRKGLLPASVVGIYELGRTSKDIREAATVRVSNHYVAGTAVDLRTCDAVQGTGKLRLPISPLTMFIGDSYKMQALGGVPPYRFDLVATGASSGALSAAGLYSAPPTVGQIPVRVTDGAGSTADGQIDVVDPSSLGLLKYWFSASAFANRPEGTALSTADFWNNRGTASPSLALSYSGNAPTISLTGGPNGHPRVLLPFSAQFLLADSPLVNGNHAIFIVARRLSSAPTTLVCLTDGIDCLSAPTLASLSLPDGMDGAGLNVKRLSQSIGIPILSNRSPTEWGILNELFLTGAPGALYGAYKGFSNGLSHTITAFNGTNRFWLGGIDSQGSQSPWEITEVLIYNSAPPVAQVLTMLRDKYQLP